VNTLSQTSKDKITIWSSYPDRLFSYRTPSDYEVSQFLLVDLFHLRSRTITVAGVERSNPWESSSRR